MANTQIGNSLGVNGVNGKNINGGDDVSTGFNDGANDDTVASMRTRLAAFNAAYYTVPVLDTMSVNDMVYAIRQADAPATIR